MVEISDEQMKLFMTNMYRIDNKSTEMKESINTLKDDVKLGSFMSRKQAVNSSRVVLMTVGITLLVSDPTFVNTGLFLFISGLAIFLMSLFWKSQRKDC